MEVQKLGMITIDDFFSKYYSLKKKYEARKKKSCPICNKGPVQFSTKDRKLTSVCATPQCSANMSIQLQMYLPYATVYELVKEKYHDSLSSIIERKFDLLFKYSSDKNIERIREEYMTHKNVFEKTEILYHKTQMVHDKELAELYMNRQEMVNVIKQGGNPKTVEEDLNSVLNKIHKLEYTKVANEYSLYTPYSKLMLVE
jgi:ribosomal protein S27AE